MVIFQDGGDVAHPAVAVDTAIKLFAVTEALNQTNELEPLALHMGVNSGMALVGSTRFEGRRGSRWIFTADGPITNLAAHLADLAKPGQIALGPETVKRVGGRYDLQHLGPQEFKNIAKPVDVHCIVAAPPDA